MIFKRRKKQEAESSASADAPSPAETSEVTAAAAADDDTETTTERSATDAAESADAPTADSHTGDAAAELDTEALDELEWREDGPFDVTEVGLDSDGDEDDDTDVDSDESGDSGQPRIDLGSMLVTGFPGAELRLQVSEETQQVVSVMLISGDSAIELGAYAAPRTGGFWPELRDELIESATEAGGSAALVEGPFGVELRRLLPVTTPDGEQGYQPSRMWVVEGPRWLLRGILYGQAALEDGVEGPVAPLLTAFRQVVVRRDTQAMSPGDLLPLELPKDLTATEA